MKQRLRGLVLGLSVGFAGIFLAGMMVTRNLALEGTYTYLKLFNEALSLIRSSYVDEVSNDSLMKGAYEGMMTELDPYSEYLTPDEYAAYAAAREAASKAERETRRQADVGIRVAKKEGIVFVIAVKKGSDAEVKGVMPGDLIRRIADRSVREMSLAQVESALAGAQGETVSLLLNRREEPHKLDLTLTKKDVTPEPAGLDIVDAKDGIAVLRIPQFGSGVATDVAGLLSRAESAKVQRLIIDVRGNAWGAMDEAAKSAGLFLGDVVVARLKSRQGSPEEIRSGRSRASYSGLVGLLVNSGTAETAELFAAAVHDGRNAPIMGETSFGVGAQQEIIPLKNGGYLRLSVRKYVSPAGTSWHGVGLKPDTVLAAGQDGTMPERLKQQLKKSVDYFKGYKPAPAAAAAMAGTMKDAA